MAARNSLIGNGPVEPRQKVWAAIRDIREGFTAKDLYRHTGEGPTKIRAYLQALVKAGVIAAMDESPAAAIVGRTYKLVMDEGVEHPRLDGDGNRTYAHLLTENIWRTLRILKGNLTVADIAQAASTEQVNASPTIVWRYLDALAEAGYLNKEQGKPATYRLAPSRYTGPFPPQVRTFYQLQVYDPNLNKVVYDSAADASVEVDDDATWLNPDFQRMRVLLSDWMAEAEQSGRSAELVKRTKFELASPVNGGTLQ